MLRIGTRLLVRLGASALLAIPLTSFAPVEDAARLEPLRVETWLESGPSDECVDVLFVGDGYTEDLLHRDGAGRSSLFWRDVDHFSRRMLEELPFSWYRDRFNIRALFVPSEEEGCDPDPQRDRAATLLESHFDHWRGRILRFRRERLLTDLVKAVGDVDIVFVMVNTDRYGGSGSVLRYYRPRGVPCPAPVFAARNPSAFAIAVHELGHSFANLTDEYADTSMHGEYRLPGGGRDIDHPNATRAGRFDPSSFETLRDTVKWGRFLELPGAEEHEWVHEGSYYRSRGVFRPWPTCKMRAREDSFCPVCAEAMARAIVETCGERWDEGAYHRAHPIESWGE